MMLSFTHPGVYCLDWKLNLQGQLGLLHELINLRRSSDKDDELCQPET